MRILVDSESGRVRILIGSGSGRFRILVGSGSGRVWTLIGSEIRLDPDMVVFGYWLDLDSVE